MTTPTDAQLAAARRLSEIVCPTCKGDLEVLRVVGQNWGDPNGQPEYWPCETCADDEGNPTGLAFWWYSRKCRGPAHYPSSGGAKCTLCQDGRVLTDPRTWPYYELRWLREQGCWVTQYPEGFWFLTYPTAWDRWAERLDALTEAVLKVAEVKGWLNESTQLQS